MDLDSDPNRPDGEPTDVSQPLQPLPSRSAWHSPVITLMNIKRTMLGTGSFFDGFNLSTS